MAIAEAMPGVARDELIAALRQRLAVSSASACPTDGRDAETVRLRIPEIDGRFTAGGLPVGAVHELWATSAAHRPAATGFALALASHLAAKGRGSGQGSDLVWVYQRGHAQEWGLPYGPGLMAFGHDPGRFILVETRTVLEALWAGEETLRAALPSSVIIALDAGYERHAFMASRRLDLAARAGQANAFLLCAGAEPPVSAASLRWRVAPAAAFAGARRPFPFPACPRWRIALERNRLGRTGHWSLEWNHDAKILMPAAAVPGSVAAPLAGRAGPARRHRRRRAGA